MNVLTYQSFFRPNLISLPVSVFFFFVFFGAIYTFGLNETDGASPLIWHQKTVELTATNCSPTVPRLRVILSRRSKSTREGWRKRKPQEMGMFQEELRKQQVTFLLKTQSRYCYNLPLPHRQRAGFVCSLTHVRNC